MFTHIAIGGTSLYAMEALQTRQQKQKMCLRQIMTVIWSAPSINAAEEERVDWFQRSHLSESYIMDHETCMKASGDALATHDLMYDPWGAFNLESRSVYFAQTNDLNTFLALLKPFFEFREQPFSHCNLLATAGGRGINVSAHGQQEFLRQNKTSSCPSPIINVASECWRVVLPTIWIASNLKQRQDLYRSVSIDRHGLGHFRRIELS
jgi:hypothetical protein